MMRITFVLPSYARAPIGGYKVVYEYAERLCRRGHRVTVVHPRHWHSRTGVVSRVGVAAWRMRNLLLDRRRVPWFALDSRVKLAFVPDLEPEHLPDADILVATAWQTAAAVAGAPRSKGERKFYLVQGYETWYGDAAAVDATWTLPLHKIVISGWLLELAERFGEAWRTTHIPNGIDLQHFRISVPHEQRFARRVGMLYHTEFYKGAAEGIRAIDAARTEYPDLQAVLFGAAPRPATLPDWIEYIERPTPERLVELYNGCTVFLQPSWSEGWGLTATEAMACGCALATTDNGGSRDYARHGETALVVPARDPAALADALVQLLSDEARRWKLASDGNRSVQRFRWEDSARAMEALFEAALQHPGASAFEARA
jgi:glycosyltransferase involved in cell wall biosynthesis